MSISIKTDKSKTFTIIGICIMTLLVLTKVVPTSQLAQYAMFVGLAFFFIVESVAKTPDDESNLRFKTFFADIKKSGVLLWTLLPIVTSIGSIILSNIIFGDQYVNHVLERTSDIFTFDQFFFLVLQLIFPAFAEEIAFRGFFIGKGMKLFPYWLCAVVSSAVFAVAHIAVSNLGVVVFDIVGIFIDGLIFATIFKKTENCLISTIAHILCNVSGFAFVFLFL
ncbi:MAG: CPBP family intramembrane metalloprotease [Lachnospiraceae bacterium]|nr:CPBP family intramembrane metalloprotease [Lachnospiraceae bacterium]